MRRTHYAGSAGRNRKPQRSPLITDVTCQVCVRRLWKEAALAPYRAFGVGRTSEHGKRMRKAVTQSELATRGGSYAS